MRIQPAMQSGQYKTYEIDAPLRTHFRRATCVEINCLQYIHGWRIRIEGLSPEMIFTATHSGRKWVRESLSETETWLVFEPGQQCFRDSTHRIRIERPEIYVVRGGDFRGNPRGEIVIHNDPMDWVDDFANHQDRLAHAHEQG